VVPLIASATEIVCALGARDLLVGRSHECDYVADGNQYFNRPGPRIVESLEILAEVFHPEMFPSRYEGKGWMRYRPSHRVTSQSRRSGLARGIN